jgi:predicted nucleic acid-binding protein
VNVYLDTGVFVDYLIYRGHVGHFLRKRGRRNRTVQQLHLDVSECLDKIGKAHYGFTSCLTIYEAEEALFAHLMKSSKGIKNGKKFAVISSRSIGTQILVIKDYFKLQILDLSEDIIQKELKETDLQVRGIRAGDSLHVATAILNNADMIITTDYHLLALNGAFQNDAGKSIQCVDTNDARHLL